VSFTKGCYTGQEIVARTQHLGRIKRRMFRYVADGRAAAPPPAATLMDARGRTAEVVRSVATGEGAELLAVFALDGRGELLAARDGSRFLPADLPYPID
jgi:folate-binding Fe-S cluster repair protein YgfZ